MGLGKGYNRGGQKRGIFKGYRQEYLRRDIAHGGGPKSFLIMLGYANWGAGQLEEELKQNVWLPVSASNDLLFDWRLEKKWEFALRALGIDPLRLSAEQGKA